MTTFPKSRVISAAALLMSQLGLAACNKAPSEDQSSALELLQSGSAKVCTAVDVQQTLRDMILPKVTDIGIEADDADKQAAVNDVQLTLNNTTLQSFDKTVSRVTCNTVSHIADADQSNDFDISYSISPSADDQNKFVISANNAAAKLFAGTLAEDGTRMTVANHQRQVEAQQQEQAHAKLLAVISPQWIVGKWIMSTADPSYCTGDDALMLMPNYVFSGAARAGRWSLDMDQLHLIGGSGGGNVDDVATITQADAASFTLTNKDGSTEGWRRCARAEIERPAQAAIPSDAAAAQP